MTPDALAIIHERSFTTPRPWSAHAFAAMLRSPGVFLHGDQRGFVMGRTIADECELLTLAVLPEERGKGIGGDLVSAFEENARLDGAARGFLEVAADNATAIALYQRAGWTEIGRRPRYYRTPTGEAVDALIMDKTFATE